MNPYYFDSWKIANYQLISIFDIADQGKQFTYLMDDLVFHLEKYLNKFQIQPSNLDGFGEVISASGVRIRYSYNYDTQKKPSIEVLTSIPGNDPFIFKIQSDGRYYGKEILTIYPFEDVENSPGNNLDLSDKAVCILNSKLRISNLASDKNYMNAILDEKDKPFEKFIFISDGTLFSPSHISPFKAFDNEFCCLQQYFYYHRIHSQGQSELSEMILKEWTSLDIRKLGIIIKNMSNQKWFEESYRIIYKGIYSKFAQNSKCLEELITTRKGVFIYTNPADIYLGTGFSDKDSIDEFQGGWKGNNMYGYCLGLVRDDLIRTK